MTPADEVRQAAEKLRGVAEAATCQCGGPACGTRSWFGIGELTERFHEYGDDSGDGDPISFIALMDPTLALLVADWLEYEAKFCEFSIWLDSNKHPEDDTRPAERRHHSALVLARHINGKTK